MRNFRASNCESSGQEREKSYKKVATSSRDPERKNRTSSEPCWRAQGAGFYGPVIHAQAPSREFFHEPAQGERMIPPARLQPLGVCARKDARLVAAHFPGATLPVSRKRRDHFETREGLIESATAMARIASPAVPRAIARSRRSLERGRAILKASNSREAKRRFGEPSPDSGKLHPAPGDRQEGWKGGSVLYRF